jgi:hypothetical protein
MGRRETRSSIAILIAACAVAVLAAPAAAGPDVATAGMFVVHRVDDYDVWKKAFDEHVSPASSPESWVTT